ncbi:nucleic acid-binding protein [Bacillus timonensis]|uniref:Nucleic acid-binding protein n=1 Tax=Bacillus timonensis TaxID=1033734 RepID=A0A4S3PQ63_9BACI|nr:nucleic acid-binding protein [Bacillus timonensis]THE11628.1 nucleic acid-binding protein [Bacillus timonensis]
MKCYQCDIKMILDCNVKVEGVMYGIKISKKGKGLFNNISAKPKAAVCPNCGYVSFYIDDYKKFV